MSGSLYTLYPLSLMFEKSSCVDLNGDIIVYLNFGVD